MFFTILAIVSYFSPLGLDNSEATTQESIANSESSQQGQPEVPEPFRGRAEEYQKVRQVFGDPPGKRLVRDGRVWVDRENKRVFVDGFVTLRRGQLEMFACPVGTKEHESIVALFCRSEEVHAALLAAGATQGKPTQFNPYQPASGSTINIRVLWKSKDGTKRSATAQSWIENLETRSELEFDWVFAGSGVFRDEETGRSYYLADGGDLICVANFTSATLDLAVRSDDANAGLMFIAKTKRIPPEGTPVRLVLEVSSDPPRRSASPKVGSQPAPSDATDEATTKVDDSAPDAKPSESADAASKGVIDTTPDANPSADASESKEKQEELSTDEYERDETKASDDEKPLFGGST